MWDKADIRVPFDDLYVQEMSLTTSGSRTGFVPVKDYDFPMTADIVFVDGDIRVDSAPKAQKWDSISSDISSVAIGFFPEGNGFYPWPHVSIKASPSKILQGHNVFGTEDIRPGVMQMLANLKMAFPKIARHLNFDLAEVRFLDSTYSAFVLSDYQRMQIIKLFESLFPNKEDISRYVGYLQANKHSEYHRQKIYYKLQELLADIDKANRCGDRSRAAILSDPRLLDFADGRMRFEATTGHRALERLGVPTNLKAFLAFQDWFLLTHKQPLSQHLWHKAFDKVFSQIEGHTMKNVDDGAIKLKIDAKFIKIKGNGRVCKRLATSVFRTYRDIKFEGYDRLASEDNSAFFRNVKHLHSIGLSKAFLKSLDPQKPNTNVVPFVELIKIDFSKQRPDWYEEPTSGFFDHRRHLRLVS